MVSSATEQNQGGKMLSINHTGHERFLAYDMSTGTLMRSSKSLSSAILVCEEFLETARIDLLVPRKGSEILCDQHQLLDSTQVQLMFELLMNPQLS